MTLDKDARINYINIGLMAITACSAYFFPFETFLLAYAFLGPLHYLTEISWLHDRNYFTKGKYDYLVLLIIGVLLSYASFSNDFNFNTEFYNIFAKQNLFDILLVLALFSAILFAFVENLIIKVIIIFFLYAYIAGWLSPDNAAENSSSTVVFAFTSLLPTLIHVYLFTALFMLYGALKARSKTGLLSVVALIIFPILLVFMAPVNAKTNYISNYGKEAYYANGEGFFYTNVSILDHFKLMDEPMLTNKQFLDSVVNKNSPNNPYSPEQRAAITASLQDKLNENFINDNPENEYYNKPVPARFYIPVDSKNYFWSFVFFSEIGIMLMRFIAFAYLYHYLNWFSKTEIIRWHKVPKARFAAVILLWLAACGAYAYSYEVGLSFLFFLSFTHVLLEFPLNIVSIAGIGKESFAIFKHGFNRPVVKK